MTVTTIISIHSLVNIGPFLVFSTSKTQNMHVEVNLEKSRFFQNSFLLSIAVLYM